MLNPVRGVHLAQQERAAVPQLRNETPELVAGVGHGHGVGALGEAIAGKDGGAPG